MSVVVEVAVLGPFEVVVEGEPIPLGERARALMAALAVRRGADVRAELLLEVVWPDGIPDGGRNALQALVSRTRRALGAGGHVLATRPIGYRLEVPAEATDAGRLEAAVDAARGVDALAVDVDRLRAAIASWRGDPFVEVADDPDAGAAAGRLAELRLEAVERHAAAVIAAGGGAGLIADLRGVASDHPTREPLQRALATALYRAGRQTDALEVLDALSTRLRDELGLDPDPKTDELRTALLRHDLREGAASHGAPAGAAWNGAIDRAAGNVPGVGVPAAGVPPVGVPPAGVPPVGVPPGDAPAVDDRAGLSAAQITPAARSRPLPRPRTTFVGRDEERRALARAIGEEQLVTLVGPGGSGKTRLAIQVLGELDPPPRDGIVFVDLAPLTDPSDVLPELAASVGLEPVVSAANAAVVTPPERTLRDRIRDRLRHAELLLLIDNCEHVIDAAAAVIEQVLDAAGGVRVVATSREGLRVDGERLWPVHPLTMVRGAAGTEAEPDEVSRWRSDLLDGQAGDAVTAEELLRYDAPLLFVERARAVDPAFHLDDSTAPAVAELCRRLDGLPLGIELAAARVGTLPVTTLADRLEDRFRLLTAGRRTVRRQETLEAVVTWSYDLLDDEQRRVLRRLGLFSGTVSLDLVEQVVGDDVSSGGVLPVLTALAERSLVTLLDDDGPTEVAGGPEPVAHEAGGQRPGGEAPGRGPRVSMLETVRAFAEQRLLAEEDAAALRDRHARVIVERVGRARAELRGHDQLRWFAMLHEETDEHRAAFAWLLGSDPVLAVQLVSDLAWYAWLRDRHEEAARGLSRALAAAGDAVPAELEAMARAWLAYLLSFDHAPEAADRQAAQALAALRRTDGDVSDFVRLGVSLLTGYVAAFSGNDLAAVLPQLERVVTEAERCGETWLVAGGRFVIALASNAVGDRARSRRDHHRGIEAARVCGDRWAEFQHRLQLAIGLIVDGEYEAAADNVDRAIPLGEAIGAFGQVRTARIHRAVAAMHAGDAELAERIVHDVLGPGGIDAASGVAGGYALNVLADLRLRRGDAEQARVLAQRAEQVHLEVDARTGDVASCVIGVFASWQLGDADDARRRLDRAITYATGVPPVSLGTGVAFLLEASAAAALAEGGKHAAPEAAQRLGRAAALREAAGQPLVASERHHVELLEQVAIDLLGVDEVQAALTAGRDRRGLLPPLD